MKNEEFTIHHSAFTILPSDRQPTLHRTPKANNLPTFNLPTFNLPTLAYWPRFANNLPFTERRRRTSFLN
ncbi:MAG: hypothetical protein F6K26_27225 [Moorea sp. SIO2I5]|nr:hypothetical protein [Moorena sp. SIO2I5]